MKLVIKNKLIKVNFKNMNWIRDEDKNKALINYLRNPKSQ